MPTYAKGTRQWAEAAISGSDWILTADNPYCENCQPEDHREFQDRKNKTRDRIAELEGQIERRELPEGEPIYSQAELEAAGQGVLL